MNILRTQTFDTPNNAIYLSNEDTLGDTRLMFARQAHLKKFNLESLFKPACETAAVSNVYLSIFLVKNISQEITVWSFT